MNSINWKAILDKVGTVLVDRRFWVSLFTTIILVFGSPELLDNAETLGDQAVEVAQIIMQFVGMILPFLNLVNSWTKRAPSGLRFKESQTDLVEQLLEAIKEN
jgi:hypothetical protein